MIRILLYSNFIVVAAVVALTMLQMQKQGMVIHQILILNASCTLLAYLYPRLASEPSNFYTSDLLKRHLWYANNKRLLLFTCIFCFISCTFLSITALNTYQITGYFIVGIINLAYLIPSPKPRGLRKAPFQKAFLISICWVIVSTTIPKLNFEVPKGNFATDELNIFLIVFVTALLFDIRDIKNDKHVDLKTIANSIPLHYTKYLCYTLISIRHFVLAQDYWAIEEIIFSIVLAILVYLTNPQKKDEFYLFWVDGSLLLYPILKLLL